MKKKSCRIYVLVESKNMKALREAMCKAFSNEPKALRNRMLEQNLVPRIEADKRSKETRNVLQILRKNEEKY